MKRRHLMLALALASATACLPMSARNLASPSLVEVDVIDRDNGQALPEYMYRGDHWIAGVPGHRYSVRLTNMTSQRVLVVLSVDGVNAVTGQTAAPSQGGYVLGPWESTEIAGWRKSMDDVAQFVFTDLPDSYAARTGRPDNVGVVGVAVFRERIWRPAHAPPGGPTSPPIAGHAATRERAAGGTGYPSAPASAADQAMAERAPQQLGTGHGQREWAPVGATDFVRANRSPQQVSQIRYDDADTLVAMGVLPRAHQRYARYAPRAFPNRFVADPPR